LFLRYIGEVATAVSRINKADGKKLYDQLMVIAKKRTAEADVQLDDRGRKMAENAEDFGGNVLIVEPGQPVAQTSA